LALSIAREPGESFSRRGLIAWPLMAEAVLVIGTVAALLPWFDRFAADDAGREGRFAESIVAVRGLPNPVLPSLCASHGAMAEPFVRERLCRRIDVESAGADVDRLPLPLADARSRARNAFLAPLRDTQARLAELR
jgi:hypothetical protein